MKYRRLLLPWDEYSKKCIIVPHVFSIERNKQFLYYFGATHVFDLKDPQFKNLRLFWMEFLQKSEKKNPVVLIEGELRNISNDQEKDVRFGGEGSFITHLAVKENIPVQCPEPNWQELMNLLTAEFSPEEVYYARFADLVLQWHKIQPPEKFESYIGYFFEHDKKLLRWKRFDFSLDHMQAIHKRLFGKQFLLPDQDFFYSIVAPTKQMAITNEISRIESMIRDECILEGIEKLWEEEKNIFVVYGVGHAVVQEPALKILLSA